MLILLLSWQKRGLTHAHILLIMAGDSKPKTADAINKIVCCEIPDKEINHVFERFFKGENSNRESIGVGLSLSKMILENQKGSIKAEPVHSGGTRFIIRLCH